MPDLAEEFCDDEFPARYRPLIPGALRRAYAAADALIDRTPFLQTPGGRYERGDLVMVAASYELQSLVRSGDLPFEGEWEFFAKPTGKHFVIHTKRAKLTTNQIKDPSKKPRRAEFRENYAEDNATYLFPEFVPKFDIKGKRLLHILHGYQHLNFIHLAYPHPDENRHLFSSINLLKVPHEMPRDADLAPAEGPTETPDPETIENIERHLKDNG